MNLDIRWKGTDASTQVNEQVEHRAAFAFGRFSDRIRRVVVRLEDMNAIKGGVDKKCLVEVRGAFGSHTCEVRDSNMAVAADRALAASSRAVAKAFHRTGSRTAARTTVRRLPDPEVRN